MDRLFPHDSASPLPPTMSPPPVSPVMLATWLLRPAAFVVISVITLLGRDDHLGFVVGTLVAVGVALAAWAAIDVAARRDHLVSTWLTVVLAVLGAASGLVTALPVAETFVAFTVVAGIAAGNDLDTGPACAVVAMAILAIEVSALVFGFNTGDVGWPLAIVAGVLVGRNRRDARVQTAQAVALVELGEQTRAEERRAATLDERTRIAREIHDLLAHSLGALGIQLEAAQALLTDAADIERALPLLTQARRLASSGLEETRQAIEALRTDTPPLPDSLSALAEGHLHQHQTDVKLAVSGAAHPLSPDANLALIRIAHEALANAAKHAPAAPIAISLDYGPDRTTLSITNGSDPTRPPAAEPPAIAVGASGGYGLAGMRERLALIDGTLSAGPAGPGWAVRAQVPL